MHVQPGSGIYFVFVAAVFFAYWASAGSRLLRLAVILLANYLFCARFGLFYVLLLPVCSSLDFLIGLGLMRAGRPPIRRVLVALSVGLNLSVLVVSRHMGVLLNRHGWDWIFPLGLSFYTFQSLTYTIDLYRRDGEGTTSLLSYLSAVTFFPTLQAGPITRVTELVKQLGARPALGRADGGRAFFLIGIGLLKKALIADYLAENLVNRVFDTPKLYSGAEVLIAVYAYSLQLYYDFSGYTDIARGSAMLLGIRLPINFDRPYASANVTEFWRRWHMSFSNWLRDYLYFSLPGVRGRIMPYVNLVITMLLGGLWHGVTWTFAIWGLLHGTALAATRGWLAWRGRPKQPASPWRHALAVGGTYHFVCLTWIFFRAGSVADAMTILGRIGSLTASFENVTALFAAVLLVGAGAMFAGKQWYALAMEWFAGRPFYVHAAALLLVAVAIQFLGGRGNAPFVYSRF
ncbi:Membrane bound O-acyl transferase, MBOAT family protein [Candidatus Sulfopaludibacter sp. SbA4]|nr:Membrane bound O-acyl transferase, MBOAT family protein [Candidatus Sulfopaludibacter sp. SbA4]